VIRSN